MRGTRSLRDGSFLWKRGFFYSCFTLTIVSIRYLIVNAFVYKFLHVSKSRNNSPVCASKTTQRQITDRFFQLCPAFLSNEQRNNVHFCFTMVLSFTANVVSQNVKEIFYSTILQMYFLPVLYPTSYTAQAPCWLEPSTGA